MSYPKVYADFHNADTNGRLRLNCLGTINDLSRLHIDLFDGQPLTLYSEELEVEGIVQYSEEEHLWVALIDWDRVQEIKEVAVLVSLER
jgi:hypothetical protein